MTVIGVMMLMAACKPGTPSQYIQPDDMEDILVDYHLAKALALQGLSQEERDYNEALYLEVVLRKHGVTKALFDSSLIYYYTRADRFDDVYQRVADRLEEQALILGASEGEIGKYSQYNTTGDTANIWSDRTMAALIPQPPYNRWEFLIEADSNFRRGDAFLMQFMSDYMFQNGSKNGSLYLAVEYNDTVVGHHLGFSNSGLSQLRIAEDKERNIKALKGYFYLGDGGETTTTVRLLFLNNVQLIRFHTLNEDEINEKAQTDSLARDSIGGRIETDSVGRGDSVGSSVAPLPPDSGATLHRVVTRRNVPET